MEMEFIVHSLLRSSRVVVDEVGGGGGVGEVTGQRLPLSYS